MFDDILIGVDGRHGGHDAIALARQLASEHARFTLAHVYGAGLMPGDAAALLLATERQQTCALLAREREQAGLDAQLIPCAERSIARGLRQITISQGNDLLVVGRGHHGILGRAFRIDDTSLDAQRCALPNRDRAGRAGRVAGSAAADRCRLRRFTGERAGGRRCSITRRAPSRCDDQGAGRDQAAVAWLRRERSEAENRAAALRTGPVTAARLGGL